MTRTTTPVTTITDHTIDDHSTDSQDTRVTGEPLVREPGFPGASAEAAPTTYGELLTRVEAAVAAACATVGPDTRPSPQETVDLLLGYQHFLQAAGRHLHLIRCLTNPGLPPLAAFADSLRTLPRHLDGQTPWHAAARTLGAASDLLATHLDHHHLSRTAAATDLHQGARPDPALGRVLTCLAHAKAGGATLLSVGTRKGEPYTPVARTASLNRTRLYRLGGSIDLHTKAMLWAAREAGTVPTDDSSLLALTSAATAASAPTAPPFATSLAALHGLREISLRQARGLDPASAISLADLATLGALATNREYYHHGHIGLRLEQTVQPDTPTWLARLQAAHAQDRFVHARAEWDTAGNQVATTRALSKAPGRYGHAIRGLIDHYDQLSPTTQAAILTALPRLGQDASFTIIRLVASRDLLLAHKPLGHYDTKWRPLTTKEGAALAERFEVAATTTQAALAVLDPTSYPADGIPHDPRPYRRLAAQRAHTIGGPTR